MRTMSHSSMLALILLSLYITSFSEALKGGFSVEMIHRDSPKSPFYRPTETQFQRVANAVRRSINRVHHFQKNSVDANTPKSNVTQYHVGEYLMSYSIGNPQFPVYGIADTGSDVIWLQCKPCEICYNQTTPIFDPSKSNTYKTLPYSSTTCKSARGTSKDGDKCKYFIRYGDDSESQGDLSVDTLTLDSTNGSSIQYPRTVMGCGHRNTVSFEGLASGIVGLGRGPLSLVSQLGPSIGGKFSYCLAPTANTSSKLNFGDAAVVSGKGTVSTPMFSHKENVYYYLTLKAISVGNTRIYFGNSSSSGFGEGNSSSTGSGEGNMVIDSGSTLTLLPYDMYTKFESAVKAAIKLVPYVIPTPQLNICYKGGFHNLNAPVMVAHFEGADVQLNAVNTFVEVGGGLICLAVSTGSIPIFGNVAQINLLVGYDLEKKIVSFKPTDCSKQ